MACTVDTTERVLPSKIPYLGYYVKVTSFSRSNYFSVVPYDYYYYDTGKFLIARQIDFFSNMMEVGNYIVLNRGSAAMCMRIGETPCMH